LPLIYATSTHIRILGESNQVLRTINAPSSQTLMAVPIDSNDSSLQKGMLYVLEGAGIAAGARGVSRYRISDGSQYTRFTVQDGTRTDTTILGFTSANQHLYLLALRPDDRFDEVRVLSFDQQNSSSASHVTAESRGIVRLPSTAIPRSQVSGLAGNPHGGNHYFWVGAPPGVLLGYSFLSGHYANRRAQADVGLPSAAGNPVALADNSPAGNGSYTLYATSGASLIYGYPYP